MRKQQWFQEGDIIRLESGMKVRTHIPEKYVVYGALFSNKPSWREITIGQIFHNVPISKEKLSKEIYYQLRKSFIVLQGVEISDESLSSFVDSLNLDFKPTDFDTSLLSGEYVVENENASYSGGNTISKSFYCHKLSDPNIRVSITQDEEFMAQFPNCRPINRKGDY